MMFFSYNIGSAIVMLITALLFTLVTVLMALVLIKVSSTHRHFHVFIGSDVSIIPCICFKVATGTFFYVICTSQVHRLYRGGGGSMQRAQEEWSTGVWKSASAREAGFNAVAQTAQGPSLPQYPAALPNYPDNSRW